MREFIRASPPAGGHAASPGGAGGREAAAAAAAAASVAAAAAGWPEGSASPPPTIPPWDRVRMMWRGRARVAVEDLSYVFDARGATSVAALARGPVGLEARPSYPTTVKPHLNSSVTSLDHR